MTFKHFEEQYIGALYEAFIASFSSHQVSFKPSFQAFRIRVLHKLSIDPKLSVLAMDGDKCAGFVLQTINKYEGKVTAYNGGTGVVPEYRSNHLALKMLDFVIPELAKKNTERVLLEVVSSNVPAIKTYEKIGFNYRKTYKCYKLVDSLAELRQLDKGTQIRKIKSPDFSLYKTLADITPSFIDYDHQIARNLENEIILEVTAERKTVAYCIFQPHLGRISQMGVKSANRQQGIGSALLKQVQLLSERPELTLINVPQDYQPMQLFLEALGFQNQVDQYEMELVF